MVPAITFRNERSDLPDLKARSPHRDRSEAFYIRFVKTKKLAKRC